MAFSHAYLIELSQCWRRQPEKLAERRALWPPVLSWAWFLDPARVEPFGRKEALEILSTATMHAHRTKAPLWDGLKPIAIYRAFQHGGSYELFTRLGAALDEHDHAVCELLGVELVEPAEKPQPNGSVRMRDRRAALQSSRRAKQEAAITELEAAEDAAAAELEAERAELLVGYNATALETADTDQAEQPKE